jgi:CHAD domain-containing protein
VAALVMDQEEPSRLLVKAIKPVRKAAGKVRDMDVLMRNVLTLSNDHGSEALVRLLEHLAKVRIKSVRKLRAVIRAQESDARRLLKKSSRLMRKKLKKESTSMDGVAAPQILITELSHWPELNAENLHLFRIRIKELRYMLQLNPQPDEKLVEALGEVKDSVGEWHDWVQLVKIAQKVLDPRSDRTILKHIENTGNQKFESALATAMRVRARYFTGGEHHKLNGAVLQMAS